MTVEGCDLSHWNENPDVTGKEFIFHKATQGARYTDPAYEARRIHAHDVGTTWGAYLFLSTQDNIADQVHHFADVAKLGAGDMIALDFEDDGRWHNLSAPLLSDLGKHAMDVLGTMFPRNRCLLYCNRDTLQRVVAPYAVTTADGLWIASPGRIPTVEFRFWQYGNGRIDYDRANFADLAALQAWTKSKGGVDPNPVPPGVTMVVQAGDTLSGIAARYHVDLALIHRWNPALFDAAHHGGDLIHPGEVVHVAAPPVIHTPQHTGVYTVQAGDTLSDIAHALDVDLSHLRGLNPELFDAAHHHGDLIHPGEAVRY